MERIKDIRVRANNHFLIAVNVSSLQNPLPRWWHNDTLISPDDSVFHQINLTNRIELLCDHAQRSHTGTYTVKYRLDQDEITVLCNVVVLDISGPPRDLQFDNTGDTVKITWNHPDDDGGSRITHYLVENKEPNKQFWSVFRPKVHVKQCALVNLRSNIRYQFRVKAVNHTGSSEPAEIEFYLQSGRTGTINCQTYNRFQNNQAKLSISRAKSVQNGLDDNGIKQEQSKKGSNIKSNLLKSSQLAKSAIAMYQEVKDTIPEELNQFVICRKLSTKIKRSIKYLHVFEDHKGSNAIFVTTDDKVYSLGSNQHGVCATGHAQPISEPQLINQLSSHSIIKFFNGSDYGLALNKNNQLYGWGYNYYGQLSRGETSLTKTEVFPPRLIEHTGDKAISDVKCGSGHTLILYQDATISGWGNNWRGQVGCGRQKQVTQITKINIDNVKAIHSNKFTSLALKYDGSVYIWGDTGATFIQYSYEPTKIKSLLCIQSACISNDKVYFLRQDGTIGDKGNKKHFVNLPKIQSLHYVYNHRKARFIACAYDGSDVYELEGYSRKTGHAYVQEFYRKDYQITYETIGFDINNNWITPDKSEAQVNPESISVTTFDQNEISIYTLDESVNNCTKNKSVNYKIICLIDSGSFGDVYKINYPDTGRIYALKKFDAEKINGVYLRREIKFLSTLKGERVVQYMKTLIDNHENIYIQMEYCTDNLKSILDNKQAFFGRVDKDPFSAIEYFISCNMFLEIVEGVKYLHEYHPEAIIHRDLKPANILFDENGTNGVYFKLGDFGLAKFNNRKQIHTKMVGTAKYRAPEVYNQHYGTKSDIYSLSRIGEEIFLFDLFSSVSTTQTITNEILVEKYNHLTKILTKMCHHRPTKRPSCLKIIQSLSEWAIKLPIVQGQYDYEYFKKMINFDKCTSLKIYVNHHLKLKPSGNTQSMEINYAQLENHLVNRIQ